MSDRSALPGCRRQPSVGRQLPSVAEAAEQLPSDQSIAVNSGPIPFSCASIAAGAEAPFAHRLEQGIPFRLDRLQLRQD